jgi:hypothetical protein
LFVALPIADVPAKIPLSLRNNARQSAGWQGHTRRAINRKTIARSGAAQPRLERNLRGERVRLHWVELWRKQCRVRAADTERDKRPGIAKHSRADVRRDLVGKL